MKNKINHRPEKPKKFIQAYQNHLRPFFSYHVRTIVKNKQRFFGYLAILIWFFLHLPEYPEWKSIVDPFFIFNIGLWFWFWKYLHGKFTAIENPLNESIEILFPFDKKSLLKFFLPLIFFMAIWFVPAWLILLKIQHPSFVVETSDPPEQMMKEGYTKVGISRILVDELNELCKNTDYLDPGPDNPYSPAQAVSLVIDIKYTQFELGDLTDWITKTIVRKYKTVISLQWLHDSENQQKCYLHVSLIKSNLSGGFNLGQTGTVPQLFHQAALAILINMGEFLKDDEISYLNAGNVFFGLKDYQNAQSQYQKATRINPLFAPAFHNWGLTYDAQENYPEAIVKLKNAIRIKPNDPSTYNDSGISLDSWGKAICDVSKFSEAITEFKKAAEINPSSSLAYLNWGHALNNWDEANPSANKYQEAISVCQKAVSIEPNEYLAYNTCGLALAQWGIFTNDFSKFSEAVSEYQRAIFIKPDFPYPYINWGFVLDAWGDRTNDVSKYAEAIAKYQKALSLNPEAINIVRPNWQKVLKAWGALEPNSPKYLAALKTCQVSQKK